MKSECFTSERNTSMNGPLEICEQCLANSNHVARQPALTTANASPSSLTSVFAICTLTPTFWLYNINIDIVELIEIEKKVYQNHNKMKLFHQIVSLAQLP